MKYPSSTDFLNRPILYSLFALLLLLIWGCKQEDDFQRLASDTQLSLSSVGKGGLQANVGQTSGVSRSFGLFMTTSGVPNANNILESNHEYTYTATGINPVANPIYYPQSVDVSLLAYAPYKSELAGHILPLDISDQSDLSKIDFLYSNNNAAVNKTSGAVNLTFKHKLSKIKFLLQAGQGISAQELAQVQVNLKGFHSQSDFDLLTGSFSAHTVVKDLFVGHAREAILLPSQPDAVAGRILEFKLGGLTWSYNLPNTDTFQPGQEYQYAITFQPKKIKVERLAIKTWGDGGVATGTKPSDIEFVQIPPGTFQMGSPEGDVWAKAEERPQHWVRIDKSFLMSKYLITLQQYADFLNDTETSLDDVWKSSILVVLDGKKVKAVDNGFFKLFDLQDGSWAPSDSTENHPMRGITFFGALAYAKWAGGTLPTERQWEYACRAGTTTRWSFGDDLSEMDKYVVTTGYHNDVGTKLPNAWGLHDMHAMVTEHCFSAGDYPTESTSETSPIVGIGPGDGETTESMRRSGPAAPNSAHRSAARVGSGSVSSTGVTDQYGFRIVIN